MRLSIALGAGMLLAGCGQPAELGAQRAWVRLPAAAGRPAAGYVTITGGAAKATLLAVATPAALRSELHESMTGDHGMAAMAPVRQIDVAPGATVTLAPGGKHAMFFDLAPGLKPGGSVPLTLKFAEGRNITVTATLVAPGDPAPTR